MDENKDKIRDASDGYQPPEAGFLPEEEDEELSLFDRVMIVVRRIAMVLAVIMLIVGTALMIFASYFGQTRFLKNLPKFVNYLFTQGVNRTPQPMTFDESLLNPEQKKNPEFPKFKEDAAMMAYYRDGLLDDNFLELLYIEMGGVTYYKLCTAADLGILSDASFEIICGADIVTAAARYVGISVDAGGAQFADGLTPRRRSDAGDAALSQLPAPGETDAVPEETAEVPVTEPSGETAAAEEAAQVSVTEPSGETAAAEEAAQVSVTEPPGETAAAEEAAQAVE